MPVLKIRFPVYERIFRLLMLIYPSAFRNANGADMLQFFNDSMRREYAVRGHFGLARLFLSMLPDLLANACVVRFDRLISLRKLGPSYAADYRLMYRRIKTTGELMDTLWQDINYAFRTMAKNRAFTVIAVLTLALGIGANTAIFSVVNSALLRPLPFHDPDRLVMIWGDNPKKDWPQLPVSMPTFFDLREQSKSFTSMGAWTQGSFTMTGVTEPEDVLYGIVTSDFFTTMGVQPAMGRLFVAAEDNRGGAPNIIISDSLWQRRFGSDPNIIGKPLNLDGRDYYIVGVLPTNFKFITYPKDAEIWIPLGLDPFVDRVYARELSGCGIVGRLKPGVTVAQAQSELNTISRQLDQAFPGTYTNWTAKAILMQEQVVKNLKTALLVLLGAVGFVLLIACANVANLMLTRARSRQREIAIRAAMGANRLRLIQQMLTESIILAGIGAAVGLLFAKWGISLIGHIPYNAPDMFTPYNVTAKQTGIDPTVLAFTLLIALFTGLLFGLAPAIDASKPDLNEALKEGSVKSASWRHNRARNVLVVAQIALSMILLIGAGLMIKSFVKLQDVDPGFVAENAVTMDINLNALKYRQGERIAGFYQQALQNVSQLPGVKFVGVVDSLPLSGSDSTTGAFIEGRPMPRPGEKNEAHYRIASSEYFNAMGMRMLRGRAFEANESKRVTVINESMARRYWPNEDAIGKRVALTTESLRFYPDRAPDFDPTLGMREVVGIVADVKHAGLDSDHVPEMFVPFPQRPQREATLAVRTSSDVGDLNAISNLVKREIWNIEKDAPISNVNTMSALLSKSVARPRFNFVLLGLFAGLALLLASIGIYGVMSYTITQRTHEIGVRIALGANDRNVLALVMGQGLRITVVGVAIGLAGSFAATRLLSNLLFGVTATDPSTFVVTSVVLAAIAMLACYLPARRALRVDPISALKYE